MAIDFGPDFWKFISKYLFVHEISTVQIFSSWEKLRNFTSSHRNPNFSQAKCMSKDNFKNSNLQVSNFKIYDQTRNEVIQIGNSYILNIYIIYTTIWPQKNKIIKPNTFQQLYPYPAAKTNTHFPFNQFFPIPSQFPIFSKSRKYTSYSKHKYPFPLFFIISIRVKGKTKFPLKLPKTKTKIRQLLERKMNLAGRRIGGGRSRFDGVFRIFRSLT